MAYVKWVGNTLRHQDWVAELVEEDGTVIRLGEPVELSADRRKALEADGRLFEDSSKAEANEAAEEAAGTPVGAAGPVFGDERGFNQKDETADQPSKSSKSDK